MIDLNKLEHFVTVARTGSFVGAAQLLHLSQPALSRSIQSLEQAYGVVLFNRDRSGVRLTAAGEDLLDSARDLVLSAESLESAMRANAAASRGRVRFGVGPFVATVLLPPLLSHFAKTHSDVEFDVTIQSNDVMFQMLSDGELEFIVGKPEGARGRHRFDAIEIMGAGSIFHVRDGHPLLDMPSCKLADMSRYGVISGSSYSIALDEEALTDDMRELRPVTVVDSLAILADVLEASDRVLASSVDPARAGIVALRVDDLERHMAQSHVQLFTVNGRARQPAADLAILKIVELGREYRRGVDTAA